MNTPKPPQPETQPPKPDDVLRRMLATRTRDVPQDTKTKAKTK